MRPPRKLFPVSHAVASEHPNNVVPITRPTWLTCMCSICMALAAPCI